MKAPSCGSVAEGTVVMSEPVSPEATMLAGHASEGVAERVAGGVRVIELDSEVEPVTEAVGEAVAPNDSVAVSVLEGVIEAVTEAVGEVVDVPVRVGVRDAV